MTNLREALKAAVTKHCHVNMKWPATAQLDDSHVDAFLTEVSAALSAPVGEPVAFYVCYDGYGDHFISRERPTHHTAVCYDEDTAEEITKILNRDSQPSPGWDEALQAAEQAVRSAFESAAKNYVLTGPAGIAQTMIAAIRALRSGGAEKSDGGERCLSANETRLVEQAVIDSGEVIETLPGPSDTPARDGDEA